MNYKQCNYEADENKLHGYPAPSLWSDHLAHHCRELCFGKTLHFSWVVQ